MSGTNQQGGSSDIAPLLLESATPQKRGNCCVENWKNGNLFLKIIVIFFVIVILVVGITILILYIENNSGSSSSDGGNDRYKTNWVSIYLTLPNNATIKEHSYAMTRVPHILASPENYEYGLYFQEQMQSYGLKTVIQNFTVNVSRYNNAQLAHFTQNASFNINDENYNIYDFDLSEQIVPNDSDSATELRHQAFLGWSSSGDIYGHIVYVNYAHRKDFELLESLGVPLNRSIGICRYGGGMFRGVKAEMADLFGLQGLIIYSDPADYVQDAERVYPNGPWIPPTGYQRGSVRYTFKCPGNVDPDRLRDMCDMSLDEVRPTIPLIAMSYGNAQLLMQNMQGLRCSDVDELNEWQGGMDFDYHIGLNDDSNGNNNNESVYTFNNCSTHTCANLVIDNAVEEGVITNVFAYFEGHLYPHESVLIGGHRDAWIYGAADPISGQTVILEIARCFSELIEKHNWKPMRNIYFASWDGEEQSLIGSAAFAELNRTLIEETFVAYINLDSVVSGKTLSLQSDPLLSQISMEMLKLVSQPYSENSSESMFDNWSAGQSDVPYQTGQLGSGSDFVPLLHNIGITSMQSSFSGEYGTYHSVYDSFYYMAIVDPYWNTAQAMTQFMGSLSLSIIDSLVLPFNATNAYVEMTDWMNNDLLETAADYACNVTDLSADALDFLEEEIVAFGQIAIAFDAKVAEIMQNIRDENLYNDKSINDQEFDEEAMKILNALNNGLRLLTRQFLLHGHGLPGREYYHNVLMAPDILSGYGAQVFPYIAYAFKFDCTYAYLLHCIEQTAFAINQASAHLESTLDFVQNVS